MPPDYHMHTPLCRHAEGSPEEYAAQAVKVGLREIGFSDHSPMPRDDFDDWRMRLGQLEEYVNGVEAARTARRDLRIRLGLEVDYLPGQEEWIRELRARHPWDYFIGSVHYVSDAWDIDNPGKKAEWKKRDPWEVWEAYFQRLERAAGSGLFEIIGHVDLCKKFCNYPARDCAPLYESFARVAGRSGCAIELNTAGLRKDCQEIYPSPAFLSCAWRERVPITFGSDAHAPAEVGMGFPAAIEIARAAGYTHCLAFAQGARTSVAL